jgi:hypothetical protein
LTRSQGRAREQADLNESLNTALHRAHYEIIPDDGSYYGEIPGFSLYANASNL